MYELATITKFLIEAIFMDVSRFWDTDYKFLQSVNWNSMWNQNENQFLLALSIHLYEFFTVVNSAFLFNLLEVSVHVRNGFSCLLS